MADNYTIVIQREFGSDGRAIARKVADRLGIRFYDRDIVEQVAKTLNLPVSTISDEEEKAAGGKLNYLMHKFPLRTDNSYMQDMIFSVQKDIILKVAEEENCIIVGRCADYLLHNRSNNLNVYIYAPYAYRLEVCINEYGMSPDEAKHMILSVDKARNAYHKKYAGYYANDEHYQDLMINAAIMPSDEVADLIVHVAKKKFGIQEHPHIVL